MSVTEDDLLSVGSEWTILATSFGSDGDGEIMLNWHMIVPAFSPREAVSKFRAFMDRHDELRTEGLNIVAVFSGRHDQVDPALYLSEPEMPDGVLLYEEDGA